ncbi:MAG: hypothetical protein AAGI14_09680 [Pseudomonadota bacterium]
MAIQYKHLQPNGDYKSLGDLTNYKVVLILESPVQTEWQTALSEHLVRRGCKYVMAWGDDCSSWDNSVDLANLEQYEFGDIPEEKRIMTTWHDEETLEDVFWFCEYLVRHPIHTLTRTILVHIANRARKDEILNLYTTAVLEP